MELEHGSFDYMLPSGCLLLPYVTGLVRDKILLSISQQCTDLQLIMEGASATSLDNF